MQKITNIFKSFFQLNRDPEKYAEDESRKLVKFVVKSAFRVFKDGEFRKKFDYYQLEYKEIDRIYNELSITAIVLLMFVLDDTSQRKGQEIYFWQEVRANIPIVFKKWLKGLGVKEKAVNMWLEILEYRYKEYNRYQKYYRSELEKYDQYFVQFKNEMLKDSYVRFRAIALGSYIHLKKKQNKNKQLAIKYLINWLAVLNKQIESRV